jgi:hypothetical protein
MLIIEILLIISLYYFYFLFLLEPLTVKSYLYNSIENSLKLGILH